MSRDQAFFFYAHINGVLGTMRATRKKIEPGRPVDASGLSVPPWDTSVNEPKTRSVSTPQACLLVCDEGYYRNALVANFGKLFRLSDRC